MPRLYLELICISFRRRLVYRWSSFAGLLSYVFFGGIFSSIIIALYHARPDAGGYNVHEALCYVWLSQALIMVVSPLQWTDLLVTIHSGEVISDLCRPFNFYLYWFCREIGNDCYYFVFRTLSIFLIGMLLFKIDLPNNWYSWLVFGLLLTLGALIGIAYRFIYNILAFWLVEARSAGILAGTLALFFTGAYVPLPFFPSWLRSIAEWLPFNGLINLPIEVFLGKLNSRQMTFEIGLQFFWLVIALYAVHTLTSAALKRTVIQGG